MAPWRNAYLRLIHTCEVERVVLVCCYTSSFTHFHSSWDESPRFCDRRLMHSCGDSLRAGLPGCCALIEVATHIELCTVIGIARLLLPGPLSPPRAVIGEVINCSCELCATCVVSYRMPHIVESCSCGSHLRNRRSGLPLPKERRYLRLS